MLDFSQSKDFINAHERFIVVGHKEPDGDCLGSQLALASFLTRIGKSVAVCSAGPFKRREIKDWAENCLPAPPEAWLPGNAACILVDCSSLDRTGELESLLANYPLMVIDHHSTANPIPGGPHILAPDYPAVTLLVLELIESLGARPTISEAEYLLFGFCTDTGYFRHLSSSSSPALLCVARLLEYGASPKKAFDRMYGNRSLASRMLMARILSRTKQHFNGRLLMSHEELQDSIDFGDESRDSDQLYQMLMSVEGCEAVAILREESPGSFTIGLRSKDSVDVAKIASQLGGGGHKQASGALVKAVSRDLIETRLFELFSSSFSASS